jgi:hypothetical protein
VTAEGAERELFIRYTGPVRTLSVMPMITMITSPSWGEVVTVHLN